ncbi:sigma-54-dependent Fis family transcriptional regulator [Rouxiella badensis]|jgi:transcriptional regulator of acetoin/glycerol metabolism|uniref:Sigma-54-dependent Fis family transcriptional regulator n=1 Tax=Rouxiella badensis TaxID=1646377 RepID=A0A1X0WGV5_9GAMM|nr:sigma-54-dependent Fis family transcriptional regulator [Rouxiella badensis]MCC3731502.1 sigma-54-dependent Fis family transcriptional regulator [Rouxiella badensis]MCC3748909.1 sigma-54-dependent Fis family transcriptional regulator [Rouxiella badensis]MCC3756891.1 sigma-54-dependent Fis family transcriptional regulator [Rouxiella badensis]ORJ25990.1 sigma-54-dependent Fis family transcriptional regulator [Rouxiella badensis]QII38569.1 sigma-54-dependent Fis family transcriptional regulato
MQGNSSATPPSATAPNLVLSDSWFRSELYGLDRTADDFPRIRQSELADLLANNAALQQFARPAIKALAEKIAEKQSVVVLSDATGMVLNSFGDMQALQKAQRFALAPGNLWSECGRGTNAIGTALAIDGGCEIYGHQHYLTSNQGLYCAATTLQTPNGQIAGVLDISGPAQYPHPHTLAWVKEAAKHIEYLWMKQSLNPDQWLMSLHPQINGLDNVEEMLLIFSDNVLMAANRAAMHELALDITDFGSQTFQQLFPQTEQQANSVPLPITSRHQQRYFQRLRAPARSHFPSASVPESDLFLALRGNADKMVRLLNAGVSLCIQGETGSGKEYVSRALHQQSRWKAGKFVAINCAAIPESLIESELFGYQPGAFTGASKNGYIGKIREADGGVLFLDEIGDMPLSLQTRLLRVLQEKEVAPLGSARSWPVSFAVICATHRNLLQRVADGGFREDLLYRLQEFSMTIPPLREWPALPAFIAQLWRELGGEKRGIVLSPALIEMLVKNRWPGNVRQLRSLMKVLLALADDNSVLGCDSLPENYQLEVSKPVPALHEHDDRLIDETLRRFNGNISKAAQALGIARSTLYRRAARR